MLGSRGCRPPPLCRPPAIQSVSPPVAHLSPPPQPPKRLRFARFDVVYLDSEMRVTRGDRVSVQPARAHGVDDVVVWWQRRAAWAGPWHLFLLHERQTSSAVARQTSSAVVE